MKGLFLVANDGNDISLRTLEFSKNELYLVKINGFRKNQIKIFINKFKLII